MTKDKTATITLDFPVQLADRLLTEVTMRRPTMGDLMDHPVSDARDFQGESRLYAALCDLKSEDLRNMDAEDYMKLQLQFMNFRGTSLPD